jgi:predicted RecA/RadA family phage recombinase
MANNHIQRGDNIEVTAPTPVISGQIVNIGKILGVALTDAPVGQPFPLALTGVWLLPKVVGSPIAQGAALYWDTSAAAFTATGTPATGDISGIAWATAPADATATTVAVRLTGGIGTVAS